MKGYIGRLIGRLYFWFWKIGNKKKGKVILLSLYLFNKYFKFRCYNLFLELFI